MGVCVCVRACVRACVCVSYHFSLLPIFAHHGFACVDMYCQWTSKTWFQSSCENKQSCKTAASFCYTLYIKRLLTFCCRTVANRPSDKTIFEIIRHNNCQTARTTITKATAPSLCLASYVNWQRNTARIRPLLLLLRRGCCWPPVAGRAVIYGYFLAPSPQRQTRRTLLQRSTPVHQAQLRTNYSGCWTLLRVLSPALGSLTAAWVRYCTTNCIGWTFPTVFSLS